MAAHKQITFDFDTPSIVEEQVTPTAVVVAKPLLVPITDNTAEVIDVTDISTPAPVQAENKKTNNRQTTRGRMSLRNADTGADLIEIPVDEILFQKSYYSIGTVAEMFKVNQSLIRFWENEFDILKPRKNGKGDRLFRPEDVKNLKLIYHLLRERKYTIEGAKDFLKNSKKADEKFAMIESLKKIKGFLLELKANL
jgi:DNA-binding transcriptional MerR regulator